MTKYKPNFSTRLDHLDYLRKLAAGMGYLLTTGRGAGQETL